MTKENELLNFFKVAYANYPIDKNYLYKLVKETPEIITAFDPHRSGYYPASSSYIKWWMSYLNCSDNDCYRYFNYQKVMASITNTLNDAGDDFTYRFCCNIDYKILENIVSVPCLVSPCNVQYHLSDALLSKISHETELTHPELFLKLSNAATLNRLPVDYILRCYDRIINPSSQILKKCLVCRTCRFILLNNVPAGSIGKTFQCTTISTLTLYVVLQAAFIGKTSGALIEIYFMICAFARSLLKKFSLLLNTIQGI